MKQGPTALMGDAREPPRDAPRPTRRSIEDYRDSGAFHVGQRSILGLEGQTWAPPEGGAAKAPMIDSRKFE